MNMIRSFNQSLVDEKAHIWSKNFVLIVIQNSCYIKKQDLWDKTGADEGVNGIVYAW